MRPFLIALSFLTILPLSLKDVNEAEVGTSTAAFPLVGLFKGMVIFIPVSLLKGHLPAGILSLLSLALYVTITGAFHLDGLSDTFDGIAVRGTKQKKLSVMKDSTVGPVGVVSLIIVLLGKYVLFKELILREDLLGFLLFPVAGAMAMATGAWAFRAARQEGLGSLFICCTGKGVFMKALIWTVIITVVFGGYFSKFPQAVVDMLSGLLAGYLFGRHLQGHFGGHTGDTLGAMAETTEVAFLFFYMVI